MLNIIQRFISERKAIIFGASCLLLNFILTYPYPFLANKIKYEVLDVNGTVIQSGCNNNFKWCAETPAVNVYVYCISMMITFGIGFPLINLNLDVIYSKILGPIRQGTMQGLFLLCGEVLTIVGPVVYT